MGAGPAWREGKKEKKWGIFYMRWYGSREMVSLIENELSISLIIADEGGTRKSGGKEEMRRWYAKRKEIYVV